MANAASRKTIVGFVVIGIHVLIGLGFIAATAIKAVIQNRDIMDAALIKHEEEPPPKEPPPPPPDFKPPAVQTAVVDIPTVVAPPTVSQIVVPKAEPAPPPKAAPAPPPVTAAKLAKGVNLGDACAAYYPSASKRLNEEGSVVVLIFVAPNGRVTDSKVETSSGVQRLDEATIKCVTAQGRFEPQRVGNEAVGSWQRMKYTWRLTS